MLKNLSKSFSRYIAPKNQWKKPVNVTVTGANGNIGYATVFRIASGHLLGPNTPVNLRLLDLPMFEQGLSGLQMELLDCAFPLLNRIETHTDAVTGLKDTDVAMLIGAKPRGPGMERQDLIQDNAKIFIETGKVLNDHASRDVKVLVVGNPANTNCLIAQHYAPDLHESQFSAMTRLDHNRAIS